MCGSCALEVKGYHRNGRSIAGAAIGFSIDTLMLLTARAGIPRFRKQAGRGKSPVIDEQSPSFLCCQAARCEVKSTQVWKTPQPVAFV